MRFLKEAIARQANAEDDCTGRFWEGRFHCKVLLDEASVLTCMAYVNLNPIRAGIATDLAGSDYTTVQRRLREAEEEPAVLEEQIKPVAGVMAPTGPSIRLDSYLALVRLSAGFGRNDADSAEDSTVPDALEPGFGSADRWIGCVARLEHVFGCAVGSPSSLRAFSEATERRNLRGT